MIHHAAILGATGIEIDVKRTRDNKLIVFHDDTFSPRTVQGSYLLGRVENFSLEQIRLFGKLIYGEQIPTLSEALNAVIEETQLTLVWLDIKDPATVDQVVQIQKEAMKYAAASGRLSLRILLGIPSNEVLKAYIANPYKQSTDALVELDAQTALSLPNCKVWAPIWTRNITAEEVARMHIEGKLVFTWTVDLRESIVDYLDRVDGILSNYPSLVAGIHNCRDLHQLAVILFSDRVIREVECNGPFEARALGAIDNTHTAAQAFENLSPGDGLTDRAPNAWSLVPGESGDWP